MDGEAPFRPSEAVLVPVIRLTERIRGVWINLPLNVHCKWLDIGMSGDLEPCGRPRKARGFEEPSRVGDKFRHGTTHLEHKPKRGQNCKRERRQWWTSVLFRLVRKGCGCPDKAISEHPATPRGPTSVANL